MSRCFALPVHMGVELELEDLAFFLNDSLLTDDAAPIVTPRNAEPGPGVFAYRDVENKIAIASQWLEWTAQATAAYNEQDAVATTPAIVRNPGTLILCRYRVATDNPHYPLALVSSTTPTWNHTHVVHGFWRSGALTLSLIDNATLGPASVTFAADGTIYWLLIELRTTGARYYIKGGTYTNWTLVGQSQAGTTTPLYVASAGYTAVFSTQKYRDPTQRVISRPIGSDAFTGTWPTSDGKGHWYSGAGVDLNSGEGVSGNGLTWAPSATWAIFDAGGGLMKLGNTPTLGAEKITNGDMETGNPPANWATNNSTIAASADANTGLQSVAITRTVSNAFQIYQSVTLVTGKWYRFTGAAKGASLPGWGVGTGSGDYSLVNLGGGSYAIWTTRNGTFRAPQTNIVVNAKGYNHLPATVNIDSLSLVPLILSELLTTSAYATPNVRISADLWRTWGLHIGLALNWDSDTAPANGIIGYLDGLGNVKVDECVAGVWTNKISGAVTYVAGAKMVLVKEGATTMRAFYNNALVGVSSTFTSNNNLRHGLFNTGTPAENSAKNFVCFPRGNEGQWAYNDRYTR